MNLLQVYPRRTGLEVPGFGTVFRIMAVIPHADKVALPIVRSAEPNRFYALFEQDQVNFEIQIDNEASVKRDIGFTLDIHNESKAFIGDRKDVWNLESMFSMGKKFHFLKQSREDAQIFTGMYALKYEMDFEEAAEFLGRIGFREMKYSFPSPHFQIFVRTVSQQSVAFDVTAEDTVLSLKQRIKRREGIAIKLQRLSLGAKELDDLCTLGSYGISKGRTLRLALRLLGGGVAVRTLFCGTSRSSMGATSSVGRIGEPGVIVFGQRSNKQFYYGNERWDKKTKVEDFVVELRMVPEYGFV